MATITLKNNTSTPISFEASIRQGQHDLTLRVLVPAGSSVDQVLPAGLTLDQLATANGVKEFTRGPNARLTITAKSDVLQAAGFADFDVFRLVATGAAASVALTSLGTALRNGVLTKIRIGTKGNGVAAETDDVTSIKIGAVTYTFTAGTFRLAGPVTGEQSVEIDVLTAFGQYIPVPAGSYVQVQRTHVGGPGMTDVVVELIVERN